ncbi:MAG TPA: hypothetical protein VJY15_13090 [Candidatus Acidoferrum sp.]|nr:hypothetical protein [Candidatus Acidoferrum sp.]
MKSLNEKFEETIYVNISQKEEPKIELIYATPASYKQLVILFDVSEAKNFLIIFNDCLNELEQIISKKESKNSRPVRNPKRASDCILEELF